MLNCYSGIGVSKKTLGPKGEKRIFSIPEVHDLITLLS